MDRTIEFKELIEFYSSSGKTAAPASSPSSSITPDDRQMKKKQFARDLRIQANEHDNISDPATHTGYDQIDIMDTIFEEDEEAEVNW